VTPIIGVFHARNNRDTRGVSNLSILFRIVVVSQGYEVQPGATAVFDYLGGGVVTVAVNRVHMKIPDKEYSRFRNEAYHNFYGNGSFHPVDPQGYSPVSRPQGSAFITRCGIRLGNYHFCTLGARPSAEISRLIVEP